MEEDLNFKVNLSIVVPCYNEGKNVSILISKFSHVLDLIPGAELILVDNGSLDNSFRDLIIPREYQSRIRLIRVEVNKGYGFGILSGLIQARGEFLGWTHADLQTEPSDIVEAAKLINCDDVNFLIKGSRKNRAMIDSFFTFCMSCFETLLFCKVISDVSAQPTIMHRDFFMKIKQNAPFDFALDLYCYVMAKKFKMKIIKYPVIFRPRQFGSSSWNTGMSARLKLIKRYVNLSLRLRFAKF